MNTNTWSTANKIGLALQLLYGLFNVPSVLQEPEQKVGPPPAVFWADTILGVVLVVAVVVAWRQGSRSVAWVASAANILITLTGIPAFFVWGVPMWVKEVMVASIVWTVVSVVLTHRPTKVTAA